MLRRAHCKSLPSAPRRTSRLVTDGIIGHHREKHQYLSRRSASALHGLKRHNVRNIGMLFVAPSLNRGSLGIVTLEAMQNAVANGYVVVGESLERALITPPTPGGSGWRVPVARVCPDLASPILASSAMS